MNVAVIGGGVAGVCSAYLLAKNFEVTLFEKNSYIGGHTNTIVVQEGTRNIPIDTGFIVCNHSNYPLFYKFLSELEVPLRNSDMSFGFFCKSSGFGYTGPRFREALRNPKILLSPQFVRMILERRQFNRIVRKMLVEETLPDISLGEFLSNHGFSSVLYDYYLIPLTAAIWSSSSKGMDEFPLITFANFFKNHGMLQFSQIPQWQTVVGGSFSYIRAFFDRFGGNLFTNAKIKSVRRCNGKVFVDMADRTCEFDKVVVATHADEALELLDDPSVEEKDILGAFHYHQNHTVLHTDRSVMPPKKSLWASWNYVSDKQSSSDLPVQVTYHMNRLQGLDCAQDYFVSLNQTDRIDRKSIIYETNYTHPAYTLEAIEAQKRMKGLNGQNNTFFAGSYLGYGFHEDAVRSAFEVNSLLESKS